MSCLHIIRSKASLDTSLFLVTMHNSHFTNVTSEFAFGKALLPSASRYRKMFTAIGQTLTKTKRNCNEDITRLLPDSLGNQASCGLDRVW